MTDRNNPDRGQIEVEYKAPIGNILSPTLQPSGVLVPNIQAGDIKVELDELLRLIEQLISICEGYLRKFRLPIYNNTPQDKNLQIAMNAEWPTQINSYVYYDQYKALETSTTATATYIRQRFENAMRDVGGVGHLDYLILAQAFYAKALNIQEFIDLYVQNPNYDAHDVLYQSFLAFIRSTTTLVKRTLKYALANPQLANDFEYNISSPEEALTKQANYKIALNSMNVFIQQSINLIRTNSIKFNELFTQDFLGPSSKYYRQFQNVSPQGQIDQATNKHLELSTAYILADQVSTNNNLQSLSTTLIEKIRVRETINASILVLGVYGKTTPTAPGYVSEIPEGDVITTDFDPQYLDATPATSATASSTMLSDHAMLTSLESDDHPLYLKKAGDAIDGPIILGPKATIDGIVPSLHAHTGADGSKQISGDDIIPGTLNHTTINQGDIPVAPANLALVSQSMKDFPSGLSLVDAIFKWDGDPSYTYEIQVTPYEE